MLITRSDNNLIFYLTAESSSTIDATPTTSATNNELASVGAHIEDTMHTSMADDLYSPGQSISPMIQSLSSSSHQNMGTYLVFPTSPSFNAEQATQPAVEAPQPYAQRTWGLEFNNQYQTFPPQQQPD